MEPLFTEWLEFLKLLTRHRVRFLLIGGHAIAVHAQPRFTEDLDVFVDATPTNAGRIHAALVDFGFGAVAPSRTSLATPNKVFMLGRRPFRIDILTGIDGVTFKEAWAGRLPLDLAGARVFVIGREALVVNKLAAGRPKDLADVVLLGDTDRHSLRGPEMTITKRARPKRKPRKP
jgi:hypothetical protein